MIRSCETCEWARNQTCREGPVPIPVERDHWCGRWKLAEHLADGRDSRTTTTPRGNT